MMLDSTLGKILTKRATPTIPSDADATMKSGLDHQSMSSEAEVRLVVRLSVEEHIVFNGKVEEVKQLESEEVSRVVSKIAWDSAREKCKPVLVDEHTRACQSVEVERERDTEESHCNPSSNYFDAHVPSVLHAVVAEDTATPHVTPITLESSICTPDQSSCEGVPNVREISFASGEKRQDEDEKPPDCDTKQGDTITFDFDCETSQPTLKILDPIQEYLNIQVGDNEEIVKSATDKNDLDQEYCIEPPMKTTEVDSESQSITETLNDCLNSVDLESRNSTLTVKKESKVNDPSHDKQDLDEPSQTIVTMFCGEAPSAIISSNFTSKSVSSDQSIEPIVQMNSDCTNEFESSNRRENPGSRGNHKENFDNKFASVRKLEGCRRRNTGDMALTHKRMRRASLKDHRKARSSDVSRSPDDDLAETMVDKSIDFARNSKIFAKWLDNHFYPGVILRPSKDRKFVVNFYDGAQKNVAETDLIPLCNISGKQVWVKIEPKEDIVVNAIVHEQRPSIGDQPMFDVEYQKDGPVRKSVPFRDIFLTGEQGAPLIHQPMKTDKNRDESMFAGVDLDNIVHVKRSRRLQEMEDVDARQTTSSSLVAGNCTSSVKRKRGQYNMRNMAQPRIAKVAAIITDDSIDKSQKRFDYVDIDQQRPANSCSPPENIKTNLDCPNSNPSSEASNSTESSNTPTNVLELGQEFYFSNSSPHRTETSLLL